MSMSVNERRIFHAMELVLILPGITYADVKKGILVMARFQMIADVLVLDFQNL